MLAGWCVSVCACVFTDSNIRSFDGTVIANFLPSSLFSCPLRLSANNPLHSRHLWTRKTPGSQTMNEDSRVFLLQATKYSKRFEFQSFGYLISNFQYGWGCAQSSSIIAGRKVNLCFLIKVKTNGDGHAEITSNYHYFHLVGMNAINQFVYFNLFFSPPPLSLFLSVFNRFPF